MPGACGLSISLGDRSFDLQASAGAAQQLDPSSSAACAAALDRSTSTDKPAIVLPAYQQGQFKKQLLKDAKMYL